MKRIIYLSVWVFITVSCIYDSYDLQETGEDSSNYISFTLKNDSEHTGITRSTPSPYIKNIEPESNYMEDFIDFNGEERKDMHIFFFETGGEECIFYPEKERLSLYENQSTGEKKIHIRLTPTPQETFDAFEQDLLLNKNIIIYAVVNSDLEREDFLNGNEVKSLSEITKLVVTADFNQTENENGHTKIIKQKKFVMDATEEVYVGGWNDLATLNLKRIASKIEIGLHNIQVANYTAVSAEVKMINFINRASLGCDRENSEQYIAQTGDYLTSDYIPVPIPENEMIEYTEPFYSYPFDWSDDSSNEAWLLLKVTWKGDINSNQFDSYYKLPLSSIPSDTENGAAFRSRLRRNYIYRHYISINALGNENPDNPAEITGNFDLLGWDAMEPIAVTVHRFDWLFVEEKNVVMYPIPGEASGTYYIPYKSSSPLSFTEDGPLTATYEWFNSSNNEMQTREYPFENSQYPEVNLNYTENGQRYIKITSRVPINYVPKNISFKVRNNAELFSTVQIVHYPALYVEAKRSDGVNVSSSSLPGGISRGSNRNLYTITTLALTGDEVFNWNWQNSTAALRNKTYSMGNAWDKEGKYVNNAENAWVVSPKFVVQSSLGDASGSGWGALFGTVSYDVAQSRCKQYSEDQYGAGTWRIPTMAELYLISKLQSDSNSAVQNALTSGFGAKRAWSVGTYLLHGANSSRNTVFDMDNRRGETAVSPYVHVPICVRDVYK